MIRPTSAGAGFLFAGVLLAVSATAALAQGTGSATLDAVAKRGQLVCGVAGSTAGFSLPDSQGVMRGIDADSCRAVAAAALGDAGKIRFVPTTTTNRFTALQSGEVDMLYRSTTWTLGREGNLGGLFASINFYDGTGFLVKKATNVKSVKEMDGATICVQPGTSTELAIADYFRVNNLKFTPILIQDLAEIQNAYLSGRCDAYSTDASALAAFRFQQGDKATDHVLLPEIISKEPLGAMVRKGDDKWFDLVRWTYFATLIAEEYGITSKNVDTFMSSNIPEIRRLLGLEGDMGKALGVDNKWAYNVIKQVGNAGEIWDRNITPMGIPRGINNLWNKGGLQYAPPMR
ncbi:amino acid ABC transporter substrate-binding protein [Rhodovastum sp. RN2-1]|uniref:Amino acid ABC transporter substrate-binding protein n=2 Tax=Limobrevibacterium gyesilva TaxID=2991712 RepID=A0AA42CEG3_9PROT|nr:amino acid ABC transporter substrate-binding protein [Limobrevibacterium gyesilva]MCW3473491.1 amino acid ABC transporter substrate-binding protein [Limobrevibacterium gyesilva]